MLSRRKLLRACCAPVAVVTALLLAAGPASANEGVTPMLKMHNAYHFVFGSGFLPAASFAGRTGETVWALAWEGTVGGDVSGVMRWWVVFTPPDKAGSVDRWEIWDCKPVWPAPAGCFDDPARLIMAGYETFDYPTAAEWEAKGVVTDADEQHAEWVGKRIAEGGSVEYDTGGTPTGGIGLFTIYNTPSNKH